MSKISKSPSIKLAVPQQRPPMPFMPRKQRLVSQRTIDTTTNERQSQIETLLKINEEQLMREIKESLRTIDGYKVSMLKQKEPATLREELRVKEMTLQQKQKEIAELSEEVNRLREVYNRPKPKKTAANMYSQQHLKMFTLAEELQKQRKHLELHIEHHQKLKQNAKDLHNNIKELLPEYYDLQKRRGLKPLSYGEFRKRAIANKKQKQIKERIKTSMSSRSISSRSRLSSVRSIVEGKTSVISHPSQKNLWHIQKKRSIINRAISTTQRKYNDELRDLSGKLDFLRNEDHTLAVKIEELTGQVQELETSLTKNYEFTFIEKDHSKFSKNTE